MSEIEERIRLIVEQISAEVSEIGDNALQRRLISQREIDLAEKIKILETAIENALNNGGEAKATLAAIQAIGKTVGQLGEMIKELSKRPIVVEQPKEQLVEKIISGRRDQEGRLDINSIKITERRLNNG